MNAHVLKLFCSDVQKISGSAQVNSGKNREKTEINKQSHVLFWFDREIWSCLISNKLC